MNPEKRLGEAEKQLRLFKEAAALEADQEDQSPVETGETAYTKLTTKVKRGTGTRDQDTTKIVTRHPDPQEAAVRHQKSLQAVRSAAATARSIDPEETDE